MTRLQIAGLLVAAVALVAIGYHFGKSSSDGAGTSPGTTELATASGSSASTAGRQARLPTAPTLTMPRHAPDRELARDLRDPDPRVRVTALKEYAKDPSADPQILLAASHDPDLGVAFLAVDELGRQYAKGNVPASELIARATDRSLPEKLRIVAMDGVGVIATPEAARMLVGLLASADPSDRRSAAILLQHQDREIAVPALIGVLGDSDDGVRDNAANSLRALARGRDFGADAAAWRAWWQRR